MSDVPALLFVDPQEADTRFRVVLWASPGEGKSVGAASAPDPIVVISADRPGAYRFARRHHAGKDIRETRFQNSDTLTEVYRYLRDQPEVETVVLDPFGGIYDKLAEEFPTSDGDVNWMGLNKKITGFLYSLRELDVNVVIVAHEKLNDGKKGDGKLYPAVGGPALINKILAECDIVAHVERVQPREEGESARYEAQLTPIRNLVCKQSTPAELGDRALVDLTAWFAAAMPDDSDLPWSDDEAQKKAEEAQEALGL